MSFGQYEWNDSTSYGRGERGNEPPRCYTMSFPGFYLTVHTVHLLEGWFITIQGDITWYSTKAYQSPGQAKEAAIDKIQDIQETIIDGLKQVKEEALLSGSKDDDEDDI